MGRRGYGFGDLEIFDLGFSDFFWEGDGKLSRII